MHAALVDSGLAAAALYGVALTPAEQDRYVAEMTAAAELIGIPSASYAEGGAPASVAELAAYFEAVRPSLATSKSTADTAAYLLGMPDVEPELAEAWQVLAAAAVTALPAWARAMYGFGDPGGGRHPRPALRRPLPPGRNEVRQVLGVLDAVTWASPGCSRPDSGSPCACAGLPVSELASEPGSTVRPRTRTPSASEVAE